MHCTTGSVHTHVYTDTISSTSCTLWTYSTLLSVSTTTTTPPTHTHTHTVAMWTWRGRSFGRNGISGSLVQEWAQSFMWTLKLYTQIHLHYNHLTTSTPHPTASHKRNKNFMDEQDQYQTIMINKTTLTVKKFELWGETTLFTYLRRPWKYVAGILHWL